MTGFIIYAMCPQCMIMFGPFATDAQRGSFFAVAHSKQCSKAASERARFGTKATLTTHDNGILKVVPSERSYAKGDSSPPFPSKFSGSCYECGLSYAIGDDIRMVTIRDGAKGKAVHVDCAEDLLDSLWNKEPQTDEPPF